MDGRQFLEWQEYHASLHGGFGDWFARQPSDALAVWREAMKPVRFEDAKQASKEMLLGTVAMPQGFTKHLLTITKRAKEIHFAKPKRTRIGRDDVFDCAECQDSGVVLIFRPEDVAATMAQARDERAAKDDPGVCNVACRCAEGRRWKLPQYEADTLVRWRLRFMSKIITAPMLRCTTTGRQRADELLERIDEFENRNRVQAFDVWNAEDDF